MPQPRRDDSLEALIKHTTDLRAEEQRLEAAGIPTCPFQVQMVRLDLMRIQTYIANVLSPVSALPNEILSLVFELGSYCDLKFGLLVSAVTYRWRIVALQTPRVWTQIVVNGTHGSLNLLKLSLERSSACLIDVDMGFPSTPPSDGLLEALIGALMPHIPRCRKLCINDRDITPDSRTTMLLLPMLSRGEALHLDSLSLGFMKHISEPTAMRFDEINLPALRSLSLFGFFSGGFFDIRLPRLIDLQLAGAVVGDTLPLPLILHEATSLRTLVITRELVSTSLCPTVVDIPTLQTLELLAPDFDDTNVSLETLLQLFRAPSLESLTVQITDISDFCATVNALVNEEGEPRHPKLDRMLFIARRKITLGPENDMHPLKHVIASLPPAFHVHVLRGNCVAFMMHHPRPSALRDDNLGVRRWPALRSLCIGCGNKSDTLLQALLELCDRPDRHSQVATHIAHAGFDGMSTAYPGLE